MATIAERIKLFNSNRIPAHLAIKYRLMSEDPFHFFRATCHLFYEDLQKAHYIRQSPVSWICGDLHLENFGSYKADNRLVYFDLNDFDEAILAPVTWELARLVTSIHTAMEALGINQKEASKLAVLFLETYSLLLGKGKARYIEQQTAKGIIRSFLEKVGERRQKDILKDRTIKKDGRLTLLINNKLFPVDKILKKELIAHLSEWMKSRQVLYENYEVVDAGFRIAGTGSIGVKRYLFLLKKRNVSKKYLMIDMKQSRPSSIQPFVIQLQPSWPSEADRIVAIQERMQNIPPALLSTTVFNGESYVMKEMQPTDDKLNFLLIRDRYKDILSVIEDMAMITCSAQLRSSGRQGAAVADELIQFGTDDKWQQEVLDYAALYSRQINHDYQDFVREYKAGYFNIN